MADTPAAPTGPDDPLNKMMLGVQGADQDAAAPAAAPGPAAAPPPPAAPAGPPRLRGQRPTPPPQPGAPPEDLSLPAVAQGAVQNFAGSAAHNIGSTLQFLNPGNWQQDAAGIGAIGQGLLSKAGIIDQGDAKAQAAHQAPINAIENMNWEHYGTFDNFLRTVKNDPTTPLADAAAIGSLLTGGEGIAARVPGLVEKGLLAAASRAPSAATADALLNAAVTGGQVARGVNRVVAPVAKVARYGDPTYAAVKAATSVGKIPGAGLVGELAGAGVGAGMGHVLSHGMPIPGAEFVGGLIGDKLAKGAMGLAGKGASALGSAARVLPVTGAVSRALPMSPAEQQANTPPGAAGAPGAAPPGGAPAAPTDPDDVQLQQMERDFGLLGSGTAAAATMPPSSGLQGAPMAAPKGAMYGHIASVAANAGANPTEISTLQHIARVESSGNPNAASPSGRYHGLFQYETSNGPEADTVRALGDMKKNEARLQSLGVTPDAAALYIVHQQGAGGGPALLTAPPGTKAIDAISRYYGSRAIARQAIAHNLPGFDYRSPQGEAAANAEAENLTAADFVNMWRNKLTGVPFADGGRVERADGGQVVDLTERLMQRANAAQKAAQSATKPLLGLSDDTVAQALRVAQRGI